MIEYLNQDNSGESVPPYNEAVLDTELRAYQKRMLDEAQKAKHEGYEDKIKLVSGEDLQTVFMVFSNNFHSKLPRAGGSTHYIEGERRNRCELLKLSEEDQAWLKNAIEKSIDLDRVIQLLNIPPDNRRSTTEKADSLRKWSRVKMVYEGEVWEAKAIQRSIALDNAIEKLGLSREAIMNFPLQDRTRERWEIIKKLYIELRKLGYSAGDLAA
jgi:hypothetical protein